ncbi:MAG TPA: hypothetical protein VGX03_07835 [Candidatus Binatia bacterium]|jgi:lipopolysaccharide export LptBFGC system permease protein LptF|nr:hypothetical protein [Candidatus Binatia bacterium]
METKRTGINEDLTPSRQQLQRIRLQVYSQVILYVTALLFLTMAVLAALSPSSEGPRILTFPLLFFGFYSLHKALRGLRNKPLPQDCQ